MKKHGILNSHIAKVLADLGHTDMIAIADIGLPIPQHVEKIDLALSIGVPSFEDVVKVVLEDMVIEKVILAKELADQNIPVSQFMLQQCNEIEMSEVTHEEFKQLTQEVKVIIRTGEATPYANCILQSGVNFGQ
jgi:D-ribose pyranase